MRGGCAAVAFKPFGRDGLFDYLLKVCTVSNWNCKGFLVDLAGRVEPLSVVLSRRVFLGLGRIRPLPSHGPHAKERVQLHQIAFALHQFLQ